jgi:hypothetical protein
MTTLKREFISIIGVIAALPGPRRRSPCGGRHGQPRCGRSGGSSSRRSRRASGRLPAMLSAFSATRMSDLPDLVEFRNSRYRQPKRGAQDTDYRSEPFSAIFPRRRLFCISWAHERRILAPLNCR